MRSRFAICVSLATLALLGGAAPASAATVSHPFLKEKKLVGAAPDPGQRHPQNPFEDACGVAVDSAGYTYVSDYYHDAIDIFSSSGDYIAQIAQEDPGNGPCGLAVDSSGNVYVDNWREDVVKLAPSSYPPNENTTYSSTLIDASGTATGVAIDPLSGNVYVNDGTYIAEREPSGALVEKIGEGTLGEGYGLAVSSFPATAGDLYVADAATGTVKVYDPATDTTNPVAEIDGAGTPQAGFDYLVDSALAVDNTPASPSYGHVFVVDNIQHGVSEHPEATVDEFNAAGDYRGQISRWIVLEGEPKVPVEYWLTDAEPTGLAISKGEVYVTNGNTEGSVLDVFGPTAAANTLTVAKTGAGVGTVTSKPSGISCGSACVAEYTAGEIVKLTASPDSHSTFAGWSGGGCSGTGTCTVTMSEAKSVSATFTAIPQQTLTVSVSGSGQGTLTSSPAGISCPSACSEHFNESSTVTLTASPAPHSRLAAWSGACAGTLVSKPCQVTMSAAKSVGAEFDAIPQRTLEVSLSGPGSVTSQPAGINCGASSCSEEFDEASTVTLTATPQIHYQVAWSGCGAVPSPDQCEVTMSAAESVSATFTPIHHLLSVNVVGAGSISADHGQISRCGAGGPCSGPYQEGEAITLTASPAPGFLFAGFSGACGGTGPCHLTLEADAAATANFAAIPPVPIPAKLTLGKLTVKGATATLRASVSGPGTLSAVGGKDLARANVVAAKAGELTVPLALSGAGRRALARTRRGKLKVPVAVTFAPIEGGAAAVATKLVTFVATGRGHHSKPGRR